jgi:hypothetical protein
MVEFRGGAKIHTLGANSSWHQASTFFSFRDRVMWNTTTKTSTKFME